MPEFLRRDEIEAFAGRRVEITFQGRWRFRRVLIAIHEAHGETFGWVADDDPQSDPVTYNLSRVTAIREVKPETEGRDGD